MELITDDPFELFSSEEIKEISKMWERKDELIIESAKLLKLASKELKVDEQVETDFWFEFMEFPFPMIKDNPNKFRAILIIKNRLSPLLNISNLDIEVAHQLLRMNYDYELKNDKSDKIYLDSVKGFIISEGIKKYLNKLPEFIKRISTKSTLTHLMKIRLLKELGFFDLLKAKNIKTSMDVGKLLNLILNIELDTMRKMAANINEPQSSSDKIYDVTRPDILDRLREILKVELPDSKII